MACGFCKILAKCRSCSILGSLICISGILIAISMAVLTYSFVQKSDIEQSKKELDALKNEYQLIMYNLNKLQDFSPEDYDVINTKAYIDAHEAIDGLKNIYIATAIITTKYGSKEDALNAWKQANYVNPDSKLCNYGLGIQYFENAIEQKNKLSEEVFLEQSIKHLSHPSLSNHPQALYHPAIANLRYIDSQKDDRRKYELARKAIVDLNNTDKSRHPVGNVARNLAYAYCVAAKYSPDKDLAQEYKNYSSKYFDEIHGLVEFDGFYEKYHNVCVN